MYGVPKFNFMLSKKVKLNFLQEWGAGGPEFVGAYRLEFDMSWTEVG